MNDRTVVTEDGVELALHRLRAFRDGRPAALLVHGAFTDHRVWVRRAHPGGFAHYLLGRGLDVWLADLRNHGASAREPRRRLWRFEDWIRFDAPALLDRVAQETDGAPLAWVGHSAGGVVGLCCQVRLDGTRAPLAAIVTFGTPGPRRVGPVRRALAAGALAVARGLGHFPARALGVGSENEAAHVLGDWMGWNVRGAWRGADGFDYFAALAGLASPLRAVAGGADRWFAPADACADVVERAGSRHKTLAVYAPLSHRGLLLDPRAREQCWPETAAWLSEAMLLA
jgi:alpha-beta hydrolase superfamily lysophospholipase